MNNERIKELRKQAIDYCLDRSSQGNLSQKVSEKFAELLLEEVMQTLFITGHEDAVDTLNKHFGVDNV